MGSECNWKHCHAVCHLLTISGDSGVHTAIIATLLPGTNRKRRKESGQRRTGTKVTKNKKKLVSHEDNSNAGSIFVAVKHVRRRQKDTMEFRIVGYENTMAHRCVRNVGRLHRRWKIETKPQKTNTRRAAEKWHN